MPAPAHVPLMAAMTGFGMVARLWTIGTVVLADRVESVARVGGERLGVLGEILAGAKGPSGCR